MGDGWTISADPQNLTIPTGEVRQVVFTVTNLSATPRLADLAIVPDPGTSHPSWFTVDAPSIVLPGRAAMIAVQIEPRVAALGFGEQYPFSFCARVDATDSGDVSVTVAGPDRWRVTASPEQQDVSFPGNYFVVYAVTNMSPDAATTVLEAPYVDPRRLVLLGSTVFHLDEGQKLIAGGASAAFTLRVDVTLVDPGTSDIVRSRVSTAGGTDVLAGPPVTINYVARRVVFPRLVFPATRLALGPVVIDEPDPVNRQGAP